MRTVIQACGRVVRAPDDYGATYLADSSLLDLFDRARADTPPWFRDQVDAMTIPTLPDFDPTAALAGIDAEPSGPSRASRRRGSERSDKSGHSGTETSVSGQSKDRSSGGRAGQSADGNETRTRSEADAERRKDHPLSDVWGDG